MPATTDRNTMEKILRALDARAKGVIDDAAAMTQFKEVLAGIMPEQLFGEYAERRTEYLLRGTFARTGRIETLDHLRELMFTSWGEGLVVGHAICHYQLAGHLPTWT